MLRRREVIGWFMSVLLLACPLALSGADTEIQEPKTPIAHLEVQAMRIDWLPQVDYERLVLTVAGPGDFFIREEFAPGQTPTFSPIDAKGDRLPDGVYAYELRVVSGQDQELREKLARARETGDDSALNELRKGGGLPEKPLVQSGHLWVQGGGFADMVPAQHGPSSQSKAASKPALSNLAAKVDIVEPGDLIVQGHACIGLDCVMGSANVPALKLRETFDTSIVFENGSCCMHSTHDWALQANDLSNNSDDFLIRDLDFHTVPVRIGAGAPDNALTVFPISGNIGLGTLTPAVHLDVKANVAGQATERLQNSSATGFSGTEYLNNAGTVGLFFGIDNAAATTRLNSTNNNPIVVLTNSVEKMRVTSAGDVGVGTASPTTQFHLRGTDVGSRNKILVENAGTTNFREMLEIRNNGGAFFILKDTTVPQRWAQGTVGADLVLDEQAHAGTEYTFTNTGNLTIAGTLTQGSSRELKTALASLDPKDVLARVSALPVSLWSYKTETAVRHVGPMAEDFHQIFGLGEDDKHIAPGDQAGVALLAVQGLNQVLQNKAEEIATLQRENAGLAKRVEALEALLSILMSNKGVQAEPAP